MDHGDLRPGCRVMLRPGLKASGLWLRRLDQCSPSQGPRFWLGRRQPCHDGLLPAHGAPVQITAFADVIRPAAQAKPALKLEPSATAVHVWSPRPQGLVESRILLCDQVEWHLFR